MITCIECGKEIEPKSFICPYCGHAVSRIDKQIKEQKNNNIIIETNLKENKTLDNIDSNNNHSLNEAFEIEKTTNEPAQYSKNESLKSETTKDKTIVFGILSFIFGILSFISDILYYASYVVINFSIPAIVLGIIGIKKSRRKKGKTFSILGLIFGILSGILFILSFLTVIKEIIEFLYSYLSIN